jgi:hypothetical protein
LISASISRRSRSGSAFRSTRTSSSDALTGSACSSRSARPVRRVTLRTPSTRWIASIDWRVARSVSSSDEPGGVLTNTV